MATEPTPNLYPPVCPECEGDEIVYEQRDITICTVDGFNDRGEIELLPVEESYGTDDSYHCRGCGWEGNARDLADATFAPEEGGDGTAPPF